MKSKAAKNTEPIDTVNPKSLALQTPVTRKKVRSAQIHSVRSQESSLSAPPSSERHKMQCIQENSVGSKTSPVLSHGTHESNKVPNSQDNSVIAKASSVPSQSAYDSNKIRHIQENSIGSKAVPSQPMCDSSMIENEQLTVITKGPKLIYPNGQNSRFEEKNASGNMTQIGRGQNEVFTSAKCDVPPTQVVQNPRGVERRTYSSARSEIGSYVTFQSVAPKVPTVIRYADHRDSQNYGVESKIADLRRGLQQKLRSSEFETVDAGPKICHQPMKNCSEIDYQNDSKTMFLGFQNSESMHQEQLPTTQNKETENTVQVDRKIRDGSSSDLRPTPAKEMEQVPQLDLLPCKTTSGFGSLGTHVATLSGNSLTIKSGTKEVVVLFMNPSQSINGRGGQTTEIDPGNTFQEGEIPATTKSTPATATATTDSTADGQVLQSERLEMPLPSTCHTTKNEANITNQNMYYEKNSTVKIRDVNTDQVNDDSYHHSFKKFQRPLPIVPEAHRPVLNVAVTDPQTIMAVGTSGAVLGQSTISSDEHAVDSKRSLLPVREASAHTFQRNFRSSDVYSGSSLYHNNESQMQFPSLVPSSVYREDAGGNGRPLVYDHPEAYQYGLDQLSSHEDPRFEAHFQTQMPVSGHKSSYERQPSYGHYTLPNSYRDEFIDIANEPAYHVSREPIGIFRCRRFGPSYEGRYPYHLPLHNPVRAHRMSYLDRRPQIYRRTVYPEQPFFGCVDSGNLFFLNRY